MKSEVGVVEFANGESIFSPASTNTGELAVYCKVFCDERCPYWAIDTNICSTSYLVVLWISGMVHFSGRSTGGLMKLADYERFPFLDCELTEELDRRRPAL